MRAVVVGASSGIGRALAIGLAKRGETVALMARRKDKLDSAVAAIGGGATAIECDVTSEASCREAIDQAAQAMGGIDGMVYCPGIGPLRRLRDLDATTWRTVFDTNVIGASLITAAAIDHLSATHGAVAYLSSVAGGHTPPWPGLAAYGVSKAALDRLIESWRAEHPSVNFTRVVVGETNANDSEGPSEFASGWDLELAAEMYPIWMGRNYMTGGLIELDDIINIVDTVLRNRAVIPSVTITPRIVPGGATPTLLT